MGDVCLEASPDDLAVRALARLGDSPAVERARQAMNTILSGVRSSCWPAVAWRFSALTASGCPLEFSFSSADRALRYTAEVAGPEIDAADRLDLCVALLDRLAPGMQLPAGLYRDLRSIQASGRLDWGAWIGARHHDEGSRYKVYVEVPRDVGCAARSLTDLLPGKALPLAHRRPRFEGIGYEPDTGLLELYFRVDGMEVWETGRLLLLCGLGHRQAELLACMREVYARPLEPHLSRHRYGFSITLDRTGTPVAATLFSYAVDVFGVDARARTRLLALVPGLDRTLESYRRFSEPLAHEERAPTHHTVVAFTVSGKLPATTLTIGVVPP